MAAPSEEAGAVASREATALEDVGESAPEEGRQTRAEPGSSPIQDRIVIGGLRCRTKKFWRQQVSATVAHDACRDHLALERTFLGYLRTSLALAFFSVYIAQLFRLQHRPHPDQTLGFFVLAIPLAVVCIIAAMLVLLLGAYRFWRQQNAILRGKAHAGGWEVNLIGVIVLLVSVVVLILVIAVEIRKDVLNEA